MPKLTQEALQDLNEQLLNGDIADNFAKHSKQIATMGYSDKVTLASNLLLSDHSHELNRAVEALRHHAEDENCFHAILSRGLALKQTIEGITDPRNPHAANDFLDELNQEHCNEFSALINQTLKSDGHAIAVRCLLTISNSQALNALIKKSQLCFNSHHSMSLELQQGALVAQMLALLKSDAPLAMFSIEEYNLNLFNQFPELISAYLSDSQTVHDIAEKIVQYDESCIAMVCQQLSLLTSNPVKKNPFSDLKDAIEGLIAAKKKDIATITQVAEHEVSLGRQGLFATLQNQSAQKKEPPHLSSSQTNPRY